MEVKVYQILTGRRFLIVMDDVWSTKVLDDIRKFIPNNNNGSRIMLTTRLKEVATYVNSSAPSHEMRLMDADQSWTLLRQKVHIPHELEHTGREIARSCGGLPLAITLIAGILSTVRTLTTWMAIAENVKQSLASTDGQMEKILSLSYTHLPHHLRPCFLYLGGFPEDHEIKATKLTRLWIAEGFVKKTELKMFEDTAQEYLEDLVSRSLIIVNKSKSSYGKIKCCSLHDMVREMCIKLSKDEKFLVHVEDKVGIVESMKDQRRISISHSNINSIAKMFSPTIRTILHFQKTHLPYGSFLLLRVLDILRVCFHSCFLPCQIFELLHLRYLACKNVISIPRAISNLRSLQTLIIEKSFGELPCEIWNIPQLRHLICSDSYVKFVDPKGATLALKNLQTLQVGNLKCSILNLIPKLKKLSLQYDLQDGDLLFHNLVHLRLLEELHLEFIWSIHNESRDAPFKLVAPTSLKKLTLIRWGHHESYLDIVGPFPNLEVLKLKDFRFLQQEWTTTDEEFPQLKYLLVNFSNLRQWSVEGSPFPRLKELLIGYCWNLSEIPDGIGDIPTLELIEIKKCRKSLAESAKLIEDEAQDYGNYDFHVRCTDCD